MPVNFGALGIDPSEPDPEKEEAVQAKPEPKKRARRTKAQMIADAVIPGDEEKVVLKLTDTGSTVERPWLVAVEMFRAGKAEFVDPPEAPSPLKYAVMKMDEQKSEVKERVERLVEENKEA